MYKQGYKTETGCEVDWNRRLIMNQVQSGLDSVPKKEWKQIRLQKRTT